MAKRLSEEEKVARLRAAGWKIGRNEAGTRVAGTTCGRCFGAGYISAYASIYGGICFACNGGKIIWRTIPKAHAILKRIEGYEAAAAERLAAEAAERAANGGKTLREIAAEKAAAEKAAAEAAKAAAELAEKAKSDFLGEVGERIELVATVEHVARYEGAFGPGAVVMLRAGESAIRWFTSSPGELGAAESKGKTFRIVGTVKKHETFRDERMTHLTRVKVLGEVEPAVEAAAPTAEPAAPEVKVVKAAPPTCESSGRHLSDAYPLYDVAGIYVARACAKCEAKVKSRYNPWVFEGPYSRYASEVADHGERIGADY